MAVNFQSIVADPDFQKLAGARKRALLQRAGVDAQGADAILGVLKQSDAGEITRDDALLRVKNLAGTGPQLEAGAPVATGFEDTSKDAARILEQYHEPNRARDVLPKLALFAAQAGLAEVPGIAAAGMGAMRGLPLAQKAGTVAKVAAKTAGYGMAGVAANAGLQSMGVPPGISEAIVAATGLGTKPGREMVKAGVRALVGEGAATAPAATSALRAVPAAAEAAAASEAAPAVASVPDVATLQKTAAAARQAALAQGATAEEAQMAARDAALQAIRSAPAPAPATQGATALAAETVTQPVAVSQADEIAAKILQWKTENKWSGAQIESALRNVYGISPKDGRKMIQMVMGAQGPSPLQAPRIQVGAQKVGRSVGMTKEQVRQAAGPVLDEALGEASPVLPKQALQSIIDTMRKMPMAEREAYVARATSGKAKWQIENIRRTLEHLGLLLPLGAVGMVAAEGQ